jgi:hypothetical protein
MNKRGVNNAMTQWKNFTGSEEQISEVLNAKDGAKLRYCMVNGDFDSKKIFVSDLIKHLGNKSISEYLICQPHPHADMIIEWARTGRQVFEYDNKLDCWISLINPSWDHETRYSFNPDGDSK